MMASITNNCLTDRYRPGKLLSTSERRPEIPLPGAVPRNRVPQADPPSVCAAPVGADRATHGRLLSFSPNLHGMTAAAIFDLDRTLLRGASGPVISDALREAGVLSERSLPGEGLVYRGFD